MLCDSGCTSELSAKGEMQRRTNTETGAVATGSKPRSSQRPLYNSIQSDWSATLIASGIRFLKRFLIVMVERPGNNPVATAPGSVFVDPRGQRHGPGRYGSRFRIRRPAMPASLLAGLASTCDIQPQHLTAIDVASHLT